MLVAALLIPLACPPTAVPKPSPRDRQHGPFLADPYFALGHAEPSIPSAPVDPPTSPETLPLWDLDATLAVLDDPRASAGSASEWVAWFRWTIAAAQARPASSHGALVEALGSDTLTAARVAWWRGMAPTTLETRDALLSAYEYATADSTRSILANALALAQWELSCPVALGSDGACRMPGSPVHGAGQALIRRDPIAVERAQHWTKISTKLRPKPSSDIAEHGLLAELELAMTAEDYEAQLSAHTPDDLEFVVEDWRRDSGNPDSERIYARQVARAQESHDRVFVFFESYLQCGRTLQAQHHALFGVSVDIATRVLLRDANVMLAAAEALVSEGPRERDERRLEVEQGSRRWRHHSSRDPSDVYRDRATEQLERCLELGTTIVGGSTEVIEACRAALEALDPDGQPPLLEFVPEPTSSTVVRAHGVVAPSSI